MNGIKDLFASERGVIALLLLIACTVLTAIGKFTSEQWISYTEVIGVGVIGSKTLTTAVDIYANKPTVPKSSASTTTTITESGPPIAAPAPAKPAGDS